MKKANFTIRLCLAAFALFLFGNVVMAQTNVNRTFNAGAFLNETGWEIVNVGTNVVYDCEDAGAAPNAVGGTITLPNLPDGQYEVRGFDSFGDGWNGGSMTVRETATNLVLGNCLNVTHGGGGNNTCPGPSAGGTAICAFQLCEPCSVPLSCPADISVSTQPGICAAVVNFQIGGNCPAGIDVDFPSGSTFGPGLTTVTATTCDDNQDASCSFNVFVADLLGPEVECPPNQTIDLNPGLCCQIVSFDVTASDNCPFNVAQPPLAVPGSNSNGQASIQFDVRNDGSSPITITSWEIRRAGTGLVEVWVTNGNTAIGVANNPGAWTLLGSAVVAGNGFTVTSPTANVPVGGLTLQPGASKGIYIASPGATMGYSNGNVTTTDGTLSVISNNHSGGTYPFGSQFTPRAFHGGVNYEIALPADDLPVVQIDGPPSGTEVCVTEQGPGTETYEFEAFDAQGNRGTCSFTVTVKSYAFPTQNLTCNDNVQVSLDEGCSATVGADMILEGGPYGCYDTRYTVMILSPLGANLGNTVGRTAIGKTWTVKVIDDETNQSCWGSIIVKDKIKPTITCTNLNVPCSFDVDDPCFFHPSPAVDLPAAPVQIPASFAAHGGGLAFTLAGNAVAGGGFMDITNNTGGDVTLTGFGLRFGNPAFGAVNAPQIVDIYVKDDTHIGFETNPAAWSDVGPAEVVAIAPYFDTGTGPLSQAPFASNVGLAAGETKGFHVFGRTACPVFNYTFAPLPPQSNGGFTVQGGPSSFGLFGPLFQAANDQDLNFQINYSVLGEQIDPTDNCSVANDPNPNFRLTWDGEVSKTDNNTCAAIAGVVTRTWTATDGSGNEATCTQVITIERPELGDVDVPSDKKWTCEQYDAWPNITAATPFDLFFADCDEDTEVFELGCYDHTCNDRFLNGVDKTNGSTTTLWDNRKDGNNTEQNGCSQDPKNDPLICPIVCGLENEDIFATTGSGIPEVDGRPLRNICDIDYEYEDLLVEVCAGSFKIVRQWTIVDWCADPVGVLQVNQVIKVVDEVAPSINVPSSTVNNPVRIDVFNVEPTNNIHTICEGYVVVPPASASDNCAGVDAWTTELWTVNAVGAPVLQLGSVDGNGGSFFNVPLFENGLAARYVVRYYAADACKNEAFEDVYIRVRERVPPVAICDEITEVSITNNGQGTGSSCSRLYAEDLDDGSYDDCSPVYFLMAKMSDGFSQDIYNRCYYPSRDFCCDDLGEQTVILMVLDQDPEPLFNTTIGSAALGCDKPTPTTPSLFLSPNGINATVPGSSQNISVNFNTCMVTVQVTDKLPPVNQVCPPNQRVKCDWWANTVEAELGSAANDEERCDILSQYFGTAKYFDNCVANVTCTVQNNLDQCLEGTYRRTWRATDAAGNTNSSQNCTQTIFVDHVSDWGVTFPADIEVECGADVPDFGEPEIYFETCELVAISYEDQVYTDVLDACYKIERQWTVINWCVVGDEIDQEVVECSERDLWLAGITVNNETNPRHRDINRDGSFSTSPTSRSARTFRDSWNCSSNLINIPLIAIYGDALCTQLSNPDSDLDTDPWDGYITYEQIIKVNDTVDPVFTNGCQIPDVCISNNSCAATVLLPTPEITECSEHVEITYQIRIGGVWMTGAGPYTNVPPGQYPVRYTAKDNCNNQTQCETVLNVVDCKKPTPYCKAGIVVTLMPVMPDPMVEVWASDLNDNSFDNCPGALKFSFSADVNDTGRTYFCDDRGQNTVTIWVTDAAGNQDFCVTNIVIQDGAMPCDDDDPLIAGQTATATGAGVEGVTVNINSPSGFDANITTDANGNFTQQVPAGGDYTVSPVHDVNPLNGVTTYDLVMISKHILGVDLLDSPYQMIAADANKSNSITTFDLVELRKLILFINTEFPNNTSWRFVDKDFVFANPANPFASIFPEVININNIAAHQMVNDFVAIKVGDVNGSAAVNFASVEDRTMVGDLVLNADDAELTKGQTYTVEFKATEFAVSGYQFTLNFDNDALSFNGIEAGLAAADNFGLTMVNEGVITTSWNSTEVKTLATNDVVFGLTFTAKQDGRLSDMLNINSRYTAAEAYDANASLLNVALSFNNTLVAEGFELFQNTPNPFATTTTIGFHLPEATSATLTISDVQGKVVKVINGEFVKGFNQVVLNRAEMGATTGVLYYSLDTDTDSATRMMILVD